MEFKDKTCIITGGNSGIGRATALALAEKGVRLIIAGRTRERNEEVVSDIKHAFGTEALPMETDVSREEDCLRLIEKARDHWGKLDILVNNAGIGVPSPSIAESRTEDLEKVMRTNVYSAFWCSKAAWPLLKANEPDVKTGVRGSIINVSSICGVDAWAGIGLYAMSKHAMLALSKTLNDEGASTAIRSVAICPALVSTPMTGAASGEAIDPDDIAGIAVHLLTLRSMAWPTEYVVYRRGAD